MPSSVISDRSNSKYTGVVIALRSDARVFLVFSVSFALLSASARSFAFSRSAASMAARSADTVLVGVGAAAARWREHALLRAAMESKEIERSVLLRMSPVTVKIRLQDDYDWKLATNDLNSTDYAPIQALARFSRAVSGKS
jgi:hypothetical protein